MALSEVQLSHDVWLSCVTHALSTETEEVMGLLFGDVKHTRTPWGEESAVAQVWCAAPQLRADRRKDRVETTPEQLAAAAADAESMTAAVGRRTRVIGWYHSHPHITVHPSHVDVRTQAMYQMLDSGFVGIIVSCFNNSNSKGSSNGGEHTKDGPLSSLATPKVGRIQVIAFQSVPRSGGGGGAAGNGGMGGHQSEYPQVGSSASVALKNSPSGHLEEALRQSQLDVNRGSGEYMEKEIPLRIVPTPDFARLATAPSPATSDGLSSQVGRAGVLEPHPPLSSPSASPSAMASPYPSDLTPASPSALSHPSPPFLTPTTSTKSLSFASPLPPAPSSSLALSHTGVQTTREGRESGGGWRAPAAAGQPISTPSQQASAALQQTALPADSVPPLSLIGPLAGLPLLPRILFEEEQTAFRAALHQLASHASSAVSASHPSSSNGGNSQCSSSSSSATALASVHHAAAYQTVLCQLIDKCMLPLVAAVSNRLHEVRRAQAAAASATPSSPSSSVGVHSSSTSSTSLSASTPSSTTSWDGVRGEDRLVKGGHVEVRAQEVGVRAARPSGFADASSASQFRIPEAAAAAAPPAVGAAHLAVAHPAVAHPAVAHIASQSIAFSQQPHLLQQQLQQSWQVPPGGASREDEQHGRQLRQVNVRQLQEAQVSYDHPDGPQQRQQQQERQQQTWEQQHQRNQQQQGPHLQQRQQQKPWQEQQQQVELQQQRQQKQRRHQNQPQITSHGHTTAMQSAAPVHAFEDLSHSAFTSAAADAAASSASAATTASDDADYVHVAETDAPAAGAAAAAEGFGAAGQGSAWTSSSTRGARGRNGDGDRQWSLITGLGRSSKASSSAAAAASSADGSAPPQGRKLKSKARVDRER